MPLPRTVVECLLAVAMLAWSAAARPTPVAQVGESVGTTFIERGDGRTGVVAAGSMIEPGDTISTGADSRAKLLFADGTAISLRPQSRFRVGEYRYVEGEPGADSAVFNLIRGGLRAVTGLIGKRGRASAWALHAATATIGIRGTEFGVLLCQEPAACEGLQTIGRKPLDRGIHFDVAEGAIGVANGDGSAVEFVAGDFGFIGDDAAAPTHRRDGFRDPPESDPRTCRVR